MRSRIVIAAFLIFGGLIPSASAGFIARLPEPDISIGGAILHWDAANETLIMRGMSNQLKTPANPTPPGPNLFGGDGAIWGAASPALFTLQAKFSGGSFVSGWFSVEGAQSASDPTTATASEAMSWLNFTTRPASPDPNVSLLHGTLENIKWTFLGAVNKHVLQFEAGKDSIQGQLAPVFSSDVVVTTGHLSTNDVTFFNKTNNVGSADLGRPVPEPSSIALWMAGCLTFARRSRRRR